MSAPIPPPSPSELATAPGSATSPPAPGPSGAGTLLRVIGGLLVVVLILAGTRSLVDVWFRTSFTEVVSITEPVRSVRIEVDSGHVEVFAAGSISVVRKAHYGFSKPSFSHRIDGDQLVLKAHCGALGWRNFGSCSTDLTVALPPSTTVVVSSGAGDVHLAQMDGPVTVSTGAGTITVEGGSGPLSLESGAGDVHAVDSRSTRVQANSGAGDISLGFAVDPDDVDAESGVGDVQVVVPTGEATYRLDVDTGVGSRHTNVRSDPNATRHIRVRSGAGDVTVRYPR